MKNQRTAQKIETAHQKFDFARFREILKSTIKYLGDRDEDDLISNAAADYAAELIGLDATPDHYVDRAFFWLYQLNGSETNSFDEDIMAEKQITRPELFAQLAVLNVIQEELTQNPNIVNCHYAEKMHLEDDSPCPHGSSPTPAVAAESLQDMADRDLEDRRRRGLDRKVPSPASIMNY